jgi:hypothetical protein
MTMQNPELDPDEEQEERDRLNDEDDEEALNRQKKDDDEDDEVPYSDDFSGSKDGDLRHAGVNFQP